MLTMNLNYGRNGMSEDKPSDTIDELAPLKELGDLIEEHTKGLREELRKRNRTIERYRSRNAMLLDAIREAMDEPFNVVVPPPPKLDRRKKEHREAILHLCDTHLGKLTPSYSMEIARERVLMAGQKTIRLTHDLKAAYKTEKLHLLLGGDLVEGELIYARQAHEIEVPLIKQAVQEGPAVFVALIMLLLEEFREIEIYSVPGNHGRSAKAGARETNWDTVIASVIKDRLAQHKETEGRVTMHVSDDFYQIIDFPGGWRAILVHGSSIRGGFAGFPWYGTGRAVQGWYQSLSPHDYLFHGHFHTAAMMTLNFSEARACASTESGNEYALAEMKSAGYPSAWLGFLGADHGIVQEHRLYLTKADERRPARYRFGGSDDS